MCIDRPCPSNTAVYEVRICVTRVPNGTNVAKRRPRAGVGGTKRNVSPVMGLGDSPCTLLVSPWLGEVVGASLAMG